MPRFVKLESFLSKYGESEEPLTSWDELAKERIARYTKVGLVLRGARYREGLSQKELARLTGISQENISKMENGHRAIGPAVLHKIAKVLNLNERLLTE